MGNDGGSIAKRDDLVKVKRHNVVNDPKAALVLLYQICHLSKELLQEPIVSCPLGRLYNKEAVISHLIERASEPKENDPLTHIRSLKDLTTLNLFPNPEFNPEEPTSVPFICPLSLREMNGAVRFIYRKPGGSVLSESSLKELRKSNPEDDTDPVMGKKDDKPGMEEWVVVNPMGEEALQIATTWEEKKLKEKKPKKPKKRADKEEVNNEDAPKKKKKLDVGDGSTPHLPAAIAAHLATAKKITPTIASLYVDKTQLDSDKDKDGRSNWMTRGAFTRYA